MYRREPLLPIAPVAAPRYPLKAWDEGRCARSKGMRLEDNPYASDMGMSRAWSRGWHQRDGAGHTVAAAFGSDTSRTAVPSIHESRDPID